MRWSRVAFVALALLSATACASGGDGDSGGGASPPASNIVPVSIVPGTTGPPGGGSTGGSSQRPIIPIRQAAGPLDGVHAAAWTDPKVSSDGRTITVQFPGTDGCGGDELSRVDVSEGADAVSIAVLVGVPHYEPGEPQPLCPVRSVTFTTSVTLGQPLGDRDIVH